MINQSASALNADDGGKKAGSSSKKRKANALSTLMTSAKTAKKKGKANPKGKTGGLVVHPKAIGDGALSGKFQIVSW